MKNVILLDFDGVIFDSVDECLLTSYNAFLEHQNNLKSILTKLEDIPLNVKSEFLRTRQYVREPNGYFVLHKMMSESKEINGYESFNERFKYFRNLLEGYDDTFYSIREKLRRNYEQYWLSLHKVYPWVKKGWTELGKIFDCQIVSNKDSRSIKLLMNSEGMVINENKIYGKEFGFDKRLIIKDILGKLSGKKASVSFVDDNYFNLFEAKEFKVSLFFANWGYGRLPDSANDSVSVLDPSDFISILKEKHERMFC
jgi:FMN phosphatase YigB (HAD superfamily)